MKKYAVLFSLLLCGIYGSRAERFSAVNPQGLVLWYSTLTDSTVMITGSISDNNTAGDSLNYSYVNADTIIVPEQVMNGAHIYKVVKTNPIGVFNYISSVTTIYLPKTIELIGDTMTYSETLDMRYIDIIDDDIDYTFSGSENLQNIFIDENNLYYISIDGVLYTRDKKTLIAYPRGRKAETFSPINGCEHIGRCALCNQSNIKKINLPNSLRTIGNQAMMHIDNLDTLFIKDSVEYIGDYGVTIKPGKTLKTMYIGTGLKKLGYSRSIPQSEIVYCYAVTPPSGKFSYNVEGILYVPQKSLNLYRNSDYWGKYGTILPIEPPIVAGVDEMTVSWVQNFSATEYVWTLYSDESHTDMVMSLTFNEKGYLTDIVLGSLAPSRAHEANAPSIDTPLPDSCGGPVMRISAADGDNMDEGERRFAEYYSFTIKSLTPNTKYYYTRQTLADDEVIDEEHGSFATLPDTGTGMEQHPSMDVPAASSKFIRDGQLQIRCQDKTYSVQGVETK